jgi:hypothetical protein
MSLPRFFFKPVEELGGPRLSLQVGFSTPKITYRKALVKPEMR